MPSYIKEGQVKALSFLKGKIERAKGLNNTKLLGKSQPRCIIKGIKGNSHLVTLRETPIGYGKNPQWDYEWSYDCTKRRTDGDFVGLKYLVYDGEEFLGGADYDISELASSREIKEELELAGLVLVKSVKGQSLRKPRIFVDITIERKFLEILPPPREILLTSLKKWTRVKSICGRVVRARGLHGPMGKKSLPMCFVRCIMSSGAQLNVHSTPCHESWTDPHWDDIFEFDLEDDEEDRPLMLVFDIFGSAAGPRAPAKIWGAGDHLGSAMLAVGNIGDEIAFEAGEARHKLPLHGDSQVIEKKIGRDGKQLRADPWSTSKASAVRTDKLKNAKDSSANSGAQDFYHLTVELFCEREELPMKHYELLHTSEDIEEDDMHAGKLDEELEMYFDPSNIQYGQRIRRLTVSAEERIVTVYGRISTALDLVAADVLGKSDPYVIVECLTKTGQHIFVYRSAVVPNDLNPTWDEGFFFNVPPDPDNPRIPISLSKIVFSIYDSDEGQIGFGVEDEGDDFLGRCGVDISLMPTGDRLCEDIPLLGCKSRPGGFKSQGGYRRYSTLKVEVQVERKVMRLIDVNHEIDGDLLRVPRHHESRPMYPPEVRGYRDLSQEPSTLYPIEYETAGRVLAIRETIGLLGQSRHRKRTGEHQMLEDSGWMKRPELPTWTTTPVQSSVQEDDESYTSSSDGFVNHRRTYVGTLHDDWSDILQSSRANVWDFDLVNRLPPVTRTASLPTMNPMNTRFGEFYEQRVADPFEDSRKPKTALVRFARQADNRSVQNLMQKPSFLTFSERQGRTCPKPSCRTQKQCRCFSLL